MCQIKKLVLENLIHSFSLTKNIFSRLFIVRFPRFWQKKPQVFSSGVTPKVSTSYKIKTIGAVGAAILAGTALVREVIPNYSREVEAQRAAFSQMEKREADSKREFDIKMRLIHEDNQRKINLWRAIQEIQVEKQKASESNKKISVKKSAKAVVAKKSALANSALEKEFYSSVRFPQNPITAQVIDNRLKRAKSPLVGMGKQIYEFARTYDVDPAFFLAVVEEESSFGKSSLCRTTHNVTNIRWTNKSTYPGYKGFIKYPSWHAGVRGFFAQIANGSQYYKKGRVTVEQIVPKWAPPNENSTNRYIANVNTRIRAYNRSKTN